MKKNNAVHLLFRIFYTSFFTILNIILVGLLVITPADAIQQALNNRQLYNVFVIAGCYLLTVVLAILVYLSRIYTNRTVLAAIPKTWIPIEEGEVDKRVRKMIVASLSRSAVIAWDSRPRASPQPAAVVSEPDQRDPIARPSGLKELEKKKRGGFFHKSFRHPENEEDTVLIPPPQPVWGNISHNGWASPTSPDLPNLQFTTVILELSHLIEARAVSLAPVDLESLSEPPMPDIRAVQLLQRPASMGLRDYIGHLTSINIITSPSIATAFLDAYDFARFGTRALTEEQFRDLMKQFAELLRSMDAFNPAILMDYEEEPEIEEPESDIDDDATSIPTPMTPRSRSIASSHRAVSRSGSEGTINTAPSRFARANGNIRSKKSEVKTAPATPRTPRSTRLPISRSPSMHSFAQSRRPYTGTSTPSHDSLRSVSQTSVIKLNRSNEEGRLPYTLTIPTP